MNNYIEEIKKFFEAYYQKWKDTDEGFLMGCDIPEDMWAENQDEKEEWKVWKLVPATITEEMFNNLEQEIGMKLPDFMKIFLSTYFHMFDEGIGRNSSEEPFEGMKNAWNPMLVKAGFLPFAWDEDFYFIRCVKVGQEQEDLGIYQIDHEVMFDFDEETVTNEEIEEAMEFVAEDFLTYLNKILQGEFHRNSDED